MAILTACGLRPIENGVAFPWKNLGGQAANHRISVRYPHVGKTLSFRERPMPRPERGIQEIYIYYIYNIYIICIYYIYNIYILYIYNIYIISHLISARHTLACGFLRSHRLVCALKPARQSIVGNY